MAAERFLSTEEVAERLQVDEQTVRRWIKSGKLEAFKPGREWRIAPAAFEALLESYGSPKVQAPLSPAEAPEERREQPAERDTLATTIIRRLSSWGRETAESSTESSTLVRGLKVLGDVFDEAFGVYHARAARGEEADALARAVEDLVHSLGAMEDGAKDAARKGADPEAVDNVVALLAPRKSIMREVRRKTEAS